MSFNFSIVSPEGKLFEGEVNSVNLPGSEGRFGVLTGHMNLTSTIKPGVVRVRTPEGSIQKFVVYDGIAEVNAKSCSLLVEKAMSEKEVNATDIKNQLSEAKEAYKKADSETEKHSLNLDIEYFEAALSL